MCRFLHFLKTTPMGWLLVKTITYFYPSPLLNMLMKYQKVGSYVYVYLPFLGPWNIYIKFRRCTYKGRGWGDVISLTWLIMTSLQVLFCNIWCWVFQAESGCHPLDLTNHYDSTAGFPRVSSSWKPVIPIDQSCFPSGGLAPQGGGTRQELREGQILK